MASKFLSNLLNLDLPPHRADRPILLFQISNHLAVNFIFSRNNFIPHLFALIFGAKYCGNHHFKIPVK